MAAPFLSSALTFAGGLLVDKGLPVFENFLDNKVVPYIKKRARTFVKDRINKTQSFLTNKKIQKRRKC